MRYMRGIIPDWMSMMSEYSTFHVGDRYTTFLCPRSTRLAIAEAAGSPSLVPLVAENRMRLNGLLDQIPLLSRNIAHSDEQHEAIVIAILAGDGDGAAAAMLAHVAGSAALLHGFLD